MGATTDVKAMLALAFAADYGIVQKPDRKTCDSAKEAFSNIEGKLKKINSELGHSYKIVWGPALFSFHVGRHIDNAIFIAQLGDGNYAVAVAGTSSFSPADWIFEDLAVLNTVPWPRPIDTDLKPRISMATGNGLDILRNIAPCPGLPGEGETLFEFLGGIASEQWVNLYCTGHSLGGALAPCLALAIADEAVHKNWNKPPALRPYAFAGPTPGNQDFAEYFVKRLGGRMRRVWNANDIVPHFWDEAQLREVPSLYGPSDPAIATAIGVVIDLVKKEKYVHLNNADAAFSWPLGANLNFADQAINQHICAYLYWAGISDWFNLPICENNSETPGPAEPAA